MQGDHDDDKASPATSLKPKRSTGHVVVFTGTLPSGRTRRDATSEAEELGYTVKNSITKATTILVYGDKVGAKFEQACKQGVLVLSEAEWMAHVGKDAGQDQEEEEHDKEEEKSAPAKKAVSASGGAKKGVVVFSGKLPSGRTRAEATHQAEAAGYEVKNSITKATTILVVGEKGGSKVDKAKDQGIEVIDENEWVERLAKEANADE